MTSITGALIISTDDLNDETIEKLRDAVATVLAEASSAVHDPDAVQGWTVGSAAELHRRLIADNRPVQAAAIVAAAVNGGRVERNGVYALGNYSPDRSLKGFTRPVRRIMAEMSVNGLLPIDAVMPMEPEYDPANPSFQRTTGFGMPADVAAIFAEAIPQA